MIDIIISRAITTAGLTWYIPVPCRGNVASVKAVFSAEADADETITLSRGGTAVNVVTPTDALAAGTTLTGVPDTTNKALIFDPDSATVANKTIKIVIPNTIDATVTIGLYIQYDNSAFVAQAASEA